MLVCDLCLLNLVVLVVSGLFEVLGALGQILLSYPVHMQSRLRSLRQGQVHVGPITWEVMPQVLHMIKRTMLIFMLMSNKFPIMINVIIMLLYLLIMIHMLCLLLVPHMFMIGVGLGAIIPFLVRLGKFTLVQLLCIKHVMLLLYCYAKMPK
jgi:hypothetical protein